MFSSSLDMSLSEIEAGTEQLLIKLVFVQRTVDRAFLLGESAMEILVELASVRAWKDDAIATERLAGDTAGASGVTVIANVVGAIDLALSDLRRHDEIERLG